MKVVLLKFRYNSKEEADLVGIFTNAQEAEKYMQSRKHLEQYENGEWHYSDREIIS